MKSGKHSSEWNAVAEMAKENLRYKVLLFASICGWLLTAAVFVAHILA